MKKSFYLTPLLFLLFLVCLTACKKSENVTPANATSNSTAQQDCPLCLNSSVNFFRMVSPGGSHLYTNTASEMRAPWQYESILCKVFNSPTDAANSMFYNSTPLYRYYNHQTGDHFYTTNFNELGNGNGAFNYEGVKAYVFNNGTPSLIPIYRYYNPAASFHFYTNNFKELGNGASGYVYEGVAFYALQP